MTFLAEQFIQLSDDRKLSIQGDLQKTKQGLANPFACDELSAEDLIYNLFKIPHKSDASIGKLIMVTVVNQDRHIHSCLNLGAEKLWPFRERSATTSDDGENTRD